MFYVVDKETGEVYSWCDGWDMTTQEQLVRDAKNAGYRVVKTEITFSGNMVVWVSFS